MNYLLKSFVLFSFIALSACSPTISEPETFTDSAVDKIADENLPEIDYTYIGQEHFASDEWLIVPFEDLEFQAEIPSWWTFAESEDSYTLTFDDGVLGELIFSKNAENVSDEKPYNEDEETVNIEEMSGLESLDGTISCLEKIDHGSTCAYINDSCTEQKCVISFEELDENYPLTIWDKGLDENQWGIITDLLSRLSLD